MAERRHGPQGSNAHTQSVLLELTKLGHIVDMNGRLWIESEPIDMRLDDKGTLTFVYRGNVIPWRALRPLLKPKPRPSHPPRFIGKDGVPSWAQGPDVVPDRKDMRSA